MPDYIQASLILLAIGLIALLIIAVSAAICFCFPRRCPNCGKLRAFVSRREDKSQFYTAGGFVVTKYMYSRKICISCEHETEEKLESKTESLIRG